jgi:gluconokinase
MGVAGSGKTTVGRALAESLGWPYFEADDFHSAANKAKMAAGTPLDDGDRAPWLAAIRAEIDTCRATGRSAVFTCSALKEKYRHALMHGAPEVTLVYLHSDPATIGERVAGRKGHYMKAGMVESQFAALEPPAGALTFDVSAQRPPAIIAAIRHAVGAGP